jgi:hypothetical protein
MCNKTLALSLQLSLAIRPVIDGMSNNLNGITFVKRCWLWIVSSMKAAVVSVLGTLWQHGCDRFACKHGENIMLKLSAKPSIG